MAKPRLSRAPRGAALLLLVVLAALLAGAVAPSSDAAKRRINLTKPRAHQIVQRGDDGTGAFALTGSVSGRGAVQARWNGGRWTTIDPRPRGGRFSGVLSGLIPGQGTLSVRLEAHPAVQDSHRYVGVGDIFVIAGQSNACGRAPVMQVWQSRTFTPSMFGNDCRWKVLKDPVDSPSGQLDSISRDDPTRASGSVWPLLATRIMRSARVPVAFIPVPYSGSSLADWLCDETWPDDPDTLYGNMLRRVTQAGGAVRAVLLWQGEWDAGSGQVDAATYKSQLQALAEATQRDLGVRLVVCQIGEIRWRQSTPPAAPFLDGIRTAQLDSWEWSDVVAPGPALYDILLHTATDDRVHYRTPEQLATVSGRWWCALAAGCYGKGDGRGPRLAGATYDPAGPSITLRFADDALPLSLPAGDVAPAFTVRDDDDGAIVVTQVRAAGPSELRLQLAREAVGALRVSLGEGHLGAVNPVPHDSGPWRLPAELFVDYPVAVP